MIEKVSAESGIFSLKKTVPNSEVHIALDLLQARPFDSTNFISPAACCQATSFERSFRDGSIPRRSRETMPHLKGAIALSEHLARRLRTAFDARSR
jgi:hypothetical protein